MSFVIGVGEIVFDFYMKLSGRRLKKEKRKSNEKQRHWQAERRVLSLSNGLD